MKEKFIIIGNKEAVDLRCDVINSIIRKNSDINAINAFSCDERLNPNVDSSTNYNYFIPFLEVKEAFQNNVCVYCIVEGTEDDVTGVMLDDWENGDVLQCSFKEFNSIFTSYITGNSITVVWIDSNNILKEDRYESEKTLERINKLNLPCLYFNNKYDDNEYISDTILKFIESESDTEREDILKECS